MSVRVWFTVGKSVLKVLPIKFYSLLYFPINVFKKDQIVSLCNFILLFLSVYCLALIQDNKCFKSVLLKSLCGFINGYFKLLIVESESRLPSKD